MGLCYRGSESLRLEKVSKTLSPVINPALPCLPLSIPAPPSGFGDCWLFIGKLEEDEWSGRRQQCKDQGSLGKLLLFQGWALGGTLPAPAASPGLSAGLVSGGRRNMTCWRRSFLLLLTWQPPPPPGYPEPREPAAPCTYWFVLPRSSCTP